MATPKNQIRFPIRSAVIGKDTHIRRALPTAQKRTIGAWCFLDHAGPVHFTPGKGLDVGPHPHTGLQTFTWMLQGEIMHTDSLGYKQLITPHQVNLMTAGKGISHTEVSPPMFEGMMESVQFWIAQPESTRHGASAFKHYPDIPKAQKDGLDIYVLVGDLLGVTSPVEVATPLMGADIQAKQSTKATLALKKEFEYGVLLLHGQAKINGEVIDDQHLTYFAPGSEQIEIETLEENTHLILIGGQPFEAPIIIWWNLVAREQKEIEEAVAQWIAQDKTNDKAGNAAESSRFGYIFDYTGDRLMPPEIPGKLIGSN